jgi:hypothetical protein
MKRSLTLLALFALLVLVPCAGMAQPAPAATSAATSVATQNVPTDASDFLATLANNAPPAPKLLTTLCDSNDDCPAGQLCCYPCGIDGCHNICMNPVRKRCPLFV